jgi:hypothetical protein
MILFFIFIGGSVVAILYLGWRLSRDEKPPYCDPTTGDSMKLAPRKDREK